MKFEMAHLQAAVWEHTHTYIQCNKSCILLTIVCLCVFFFFFVRLVTDYNSVCNGLPLIMQSLWQLQTQLSLDEWTHKVYRLHTGSLYVALRLRVKSLVNLLLNSWSVYVSTVLGPLHHQRAAENFNLVSISNRSGKSCSWAWMASILQSLAAACPTPNTPAWKFLEIFLVEDLVEFGAKLCRNKVIQEQD